MPECTKEVCHCDNKGVCISGQKKDWVGYAKDICHSHNNEEFYYLMIDKIKVLETHQEMLAKIIKTRGFR